VPKLWAERRFSSQGRKMRERRGRKLLGEALAKTIAVSYR
jgi:hypothetical protein